MTIGNQHGQAERVIAQAVRQRENKSTGKARRSGLALLMVMVAVGLLLALVLGAGHPNDSSSPTCAGQVMQPGDECEHYADGVHTSTTSYQDGVDAKHEGNTAIRIVGWVLVGLGLLLVVPTYRTNDPRVAWGNAVTGPCPRCGQRSLREKATSVSDKHGRKTVTTTGIVTLCAPECNFAQVRRP